MSEDDDSISGTSNVSEGAKTNSILESQIDSGIPKQTKIGIATEEETTKVLTQSKNSDKSLRKHMKQFTKPSQKVSVVNSSINSLGDQLKSNPNTYNYENFTSKSFSSAQIKEKLTEKIAKNVKSIKMINHKSVHIPASKPKSSGKPDTERFKFYIAQSHERLQKKKKEREIIEAEECSFKPQILCKSSEKIRTADKFYQDMIRHKHSTDKKIANVKENQSKPQHFAFKPDLCSRSIKLSKNREGKCHERLYSLSTYKDSVLASNDSKETSHTKNFMPKISKFARNINRLSDVSTHLYQDALRRMKKKPRETPFSTAEASKKSKLILKKNFIEEFAENLKKIDIDNRGKINYTQFVSLLKYLKFLKPNDKPIAEEFRILIKIWESLSDNTGFIQVKDLLTFLIDKLIERDFQSIETYHHLIKNRNELTRKKVKSLACLNFYKTFDTPTYSEFNNKTPESASFKSYRKFYESQDGLPFYKDSPFLKLNEVSEHVPSLSGSECIIQEDSSAIEVGDLYLPKLSSLSEDRNENTNPCFR